MKLRGSATLEAAVIVPVFTMIVVLIIGLAMDCHDTAIINCTSDKLCMEVEFTGLREGKYDAGKMKELSGKGSEYIKTKTLRNSRVMQIEEKILSIETEYSSIKKNNPVNYVRMTDAAEKLIGKGEAGND